MDILFKNSRLRTTCNDLGKLSKKYGQKRAELIMRRLAELQAMPDLSMALQLPQLRCHELKGDRKGKLAVDLDHPFRLILSIPQNPYPAKTDGGLDWHQVTTIQIEEIEDYHGKRKKK